MIIDLKFKNWMSFKEKTDFSLVATSERQLKNRVPQIRKSPVLNISPVAVMFGGNASGKTNFFKLLMFLKNMVMKPLWDKEKEFPFDSFALSPDSAVKPTEITLSFLTVDDKIYTFYVAFTRNAVLEESLSIVKTSGETLVYSRKGNKVTLHLPALERNEFAKAHAHLIEKNQFFIGVAGARVEQLKDPYNWFYYQLTLITPQHQYGGLGYRLETKQTDPEYFAKLLNQFDTGIYNLGMDEISFSSLPPCLGTESEIKEKLRNGSSVEFNVGGARFIISRKDDKLTVKKMVSYHKDKNGNQIKFDLSQESDGSLRLLDILPAFIKLEQANLPYVYIIDELDRSWHYELSYSLLNTYLSSCSKKSRSQLIFSTHDLMLMDQSLFRRDEIWLVSRNQNGESGLRSMAEYDIRSDKDIRKLYLQGALDGIPIITRFGSLVD